jgi:signal transduction histidine kinase
LASSERGIAVREPVDLAVIAQRALSRATCELTIEGNFQPAPTTGDPALLAQMAANLIDNAIDHNVPNGHVSVVTSVDDGHAVLSVSNSGPPIPADEVPRLFEPFHRGAATRMESGNGHHGLGLSIVRAIATAHGATVTAHPRPDGGLTITFAAPRHEPPTE